MQADFSRTTFDPAKHFSSVLSQQGRVQLDADLNEQAAILLHQLRTVVADILGPEGGAPAGDGGGFEIGEVSGKTVREDLSISAGRFYVDGILVENEDATSYWEQPDGHLDADDDDDQLPPALPFVVYLRVWEQLVTAVQDPAIREIALGDPGPDTAARARVVWQVAAHEVTETVDGAEDALDEFTQWLNELAENRGQLRADAKRPDGAGDHPCDRSPEARFRGPENQLYRVEVHSGGQPTGEISRRGSKSVHGATFKWSRENASVVFPIVSIRGAVVELATLGRDGKLDLEVGDRVEIVDDASAARVADDVRVADATPAPRLRKVLAVDAADRTVTLDEHEDDDTCHAGRNGLLRRWDHGSPEGLAEDGAVPIREGRWLDLEDGVRVSFHGPGEGSGSYRRGDYWLIPARTVTGDVSWPQDEHGPTPTDPHGVPYHYAPLAFVSSGGQLDSTVRRVFAPLDEPATTTAEDQTPEPAAKPARGRPKPREADSTRRPAGEAKEQDDG